MNAIARLNGDQIAELELELRLLAGVISVGATFDDSGRALSLSVVAIDPRPDLSEVATEIAHGHGVETTVDVIAFDELVSPAPIRPLTESEGRIALSGAEHDPDSGTTVVHLSYGGRESAGRSTNGPLVGAAEATLGAAVDLGVPAVAYLFSVSRVAGKPGSPVTAVLRPRRGGGNCVGTARGGTDTEAACRATLCALNRLLGQ